MSGYGLVVALIAVGFCCSAAQAASSAKMQAINACPGRVGPACKVYGRKSVCASENKRRVVRADMTRTSHNCSVWPN